MNRVMEDGEDWLGLSIPESVLLSDAKYALTAFYKLKVAAIGSESESSALNNTNTFRFDTAQHAVLFPFQVCNMSTLNIILWTCC